MGIINYSGVVIFLIEKGGKQQITPCLTSSISYIAQPFNRAIKKKHPVTEVLCDIYVKY